MVDGVGEARSVNTCIDTISLALQYPIHWYRDRDSISPNATNRTSSILFNKSFPRLFHHGLHQGQLPQSRVHRPQLRVSFMLNTPRVKFILTDV